MNNPSIPCECGCGVVFPKYDSSRRPRRFVSGHNARRYYGKDATAWAREKRWRKKRPDKIREGKKRFYRRRKLRAMLFLGNACRFCGLKYNGKNAPVFEFHHHNPANKDFGVTRMFGNGTWEKVLRELKKCYLVCANCHNQHHGGEW